MIRFLLICLALSLSLPAAAQTTDLRVIDNESAARNWRAVGRLDLGNGRAHCSGVLIARDLVLTAAHCLYQPNSDDVFASKDIVFHAGLRDGSAAASRRAVDVAPHASFKPLGDKSFDNVRFDVGLIRLAEPISSFDVPSFPISAESPRPGPVSLVSYGRGRMQTQSRQKECQMQERIEDILFFDCDVVPGTSGAPVFSHKNGRGQILSVISGTATAGGRSVAAGMRLPERVSEIQRQMRIQTSRPVATVRRLGVGNRSGGAKFVRADGG